MINPECKDKDTLALIQYIAEEDKLEKNWSSSRCGATTYGAKLWQMGINNLSDDIKRQPEKVYLLVAHNGISRAVESYFRDMTNAEYAAFGIKNCEIRRYDFQGDNLCD